MDTKKRKLQGQPLGSNTRPRVYPQQGFPQRNQGPPNQWNRDQFPQRPQYHQQYSHQNQQRPQQQYGNKSQQRPQQQASNQAPRQGVPNNAPGKSAAPSGNPNACYRCGEVGHYAYQCPKKQNPPAQQNQNSNQRLARPPFSGRVNHVSTNTQHRKLLKL
ncbi:cleavage and polyadenylation specificity factor subunit 4-like [Sorghum bicolor]|uniref:cleavage and polyadenylation specificity factor subunit 4-like n=1 Tax=Sorghum bicolor TaxID=4558 RepID=UPI000B423EFA|nr:cleavage and polyadenylation specificity factor subunit 4-like [Sorghum bicolor]|eukprot:XP_021305484.1 cleavage and polyadenylation specificity factor subunit 4-like [Sorghum bicolor]